MERRRRREAGGRSPDVGLRLLEVVRRRRAVLVEAELLREGVVGPVLVVVRGVVWVPEGGQRSGTRVGRRQDLHRLLEPHVGLRETSRSLVTFDLELQL